MRKSIFLVAAILVACGLIAFAEQWQIDYGNVSDPIRLQQLLENRLGTVEADITNLKSQNNLGTGKIYYVDSAVGNDNYVGTKPEWAKATLDAAVGLCTAFNGDIIYVMQGHNESLTAANGVDIDVNGVTVIGLGNGTDAPTFDFDLAAGEFVIGASNVKIYNLRFLPSANIVTHAIDIENAGDYACIYNCYFLDGETAGTDEFVDTIQVGTTATDVVIAYCGYFSTGTGSNNFVDLSAATIVNPTIIGCNIRGAFAEAAIWGDTAVPTNVLIAGCTITQTTASQFCVEFQAAATGVIEDCKLNATSTAYALDPGSLSVFNVTERIIGTSDLSDSPVFPPDDTGGNALGYNDNDNVFVSSSVASNRDGSVLERLEFISKYLETGTAGALVAPADTFSLLDILGSDGFTATGAVAGSLMGAIGTNEAASATPFTSTAVQSDPDGSLLERQEYMQKLQEVLTAKQMKSIAGSAMPLAVWYVDPAATGTGDGKSPANAFTTIDLAIAACSNTVDDWVLVYDYSGSTATITISKSWVHLIGNSWGNHPWPRIKATSGYGITVANGAGHVEISNFVIGGDATHAGIYFGAGVVAWNWNIHDCVFGLDASSNAQEGILTAASADAVSLLVENCRFMNSAGAGITQEGIELSGVATRGIIRNNTFENLGTTTYPAINVVAGTVGLTIENNTFQINTDGLGAAVNLAGAVEDARVTGNKASYGDNEIVSEVFRDQGSGNEFGQNDDGLAWRTHQMLDTLFSYMTKSAIGSAMPRKIWYVDGGITASGNGRTPKTAFKTIDEAITAGDDAVDDWILVSDYSGSTATISLSDSFCHIIGGGRNGDKPWARVKPTNNVYGFTVVHSKGTIEIANLVIGGGSTSAAIGWATGVVADSYYIHDCVFGWDSSSLCEQGIEVMATGDAPSLKVENCRFFGSVSGSGILIAGNATKGIITDCYFSGVGAAATPAISVSSGGVGIRIENNRFHVLTDEAGAAITLSAASSDCWVNNNYANDGKDATGANPFVDGASTNGWGMNYKDIRVTLP